MKFNTSVSELVISSDASDEALGGGFMIFKHEASERYTHKDLTFDSMCTREMSAEEKSLSSTFRELAAIEYVIHRIKIFIFANIKNISNIVVLMDNQSRVHTTTPQTKFARE